LNNAGLPNKSPKPIAPSDDIPVAHRERVAPLKKGLTLKTVLLWSGLTGLGLGALLAGAVFALRTSQPPETAKEPNNSTSANPSPTVSPSGDTMLGHYAYKEAPASELESIGNDNGIRLRRAAAKAYRDMVSAAQQDGVSLTAISAFRTIDDQKYLYFDVKAQRAQGPSERAKVSAPPGYSEHHTGYAIDIGDGNVPATNLSQSFDQTAAFRWLEANAPRYSFEISFPKDNKQGVSYEPWHWRYVGDSDSLKTFYKSRPKS
jgi:zinc D-Ala-D-Ala carboxypeptidase